MTEEERKRIYNSGDYRSLSDSQRREFRHVVEDLDGRGLLKVTDVPIIASYARNVLLARLASKELEKRGILLVEEDKYHGTKVKQNPAVDVLQRAQRALEDTAIRLGITPTGRKRLPGDGQKKSELDTFMEEMNHGSNA